MSSNAGVIGHETFNWKSLSVIAGLTIWNFYFRLYPGSIKSPQVIEFLEHLQRHIGGKLLVIWDGAPIHRSRLVQDYLDGLKGKIWVESQVGEGSRFVFCLPVSSRQHH